MHGRSGRLSRRQVARAAIVLVAAAALSGVGSASATTGDITTYAGGASSDAPLAAAARLSYPEGIAVDGLGRVVIVDGGNVRIRRAVPEGPIGTLAGNGVVADSGDGGPAVAASMQSPDGVAVAADGSIYFSDTGSDKVRKISPNGIVTTVAGTGSYSGTSPDGLAATATGLFDPTGIAIDPAGNLFIAETGASRIRKVDPSGIVSTVTGTIDPQLTPDGWVTNTLRFAWPRGVAVDRAGNLFVADTQQHRVVKVAPGGSGSIVAGTGAPGSSGDGGPSRLATLWSPAGVAVDNSGNVFIADGNNRVRKVSSNLIITNFAGTGYYGSSGDGGPASAATFYGPWHVTVDANGTVYVSDHGNHRIRQIGTDGLIKATAGTGVNGFMGDSDLSVTSSLLYPAGVTMDKAGNLFIADTSNNRIRKRTPAGAITTVAGRGPYGFSGDGGPATDALLAQPSGVALDSGGNLFIADTSNSRIRRVSPSGIITTVAGTGDSGFDGDGIRATSRQLFAPYAIAVDGLGIVFIADTNNHRIRRLDPSIGLITTVAGNGAQGFSGDGGRATSAALYSPHGLALDSSGNILIADTGNNVIRKVDAYGVITTVAGTGSYAYSGDGGPATAATMRWPYAVAIDGRGRFYIADTVNDRVRRVDAAGTITTVAGDGVQGFGGDGGPATLGRINHPTSLTFDAAGNLYIADIGNSRIRRVAA